MGDRSMEVTTVGGAAPRVIGAGEQEMLNVFGVGVTVLLAAEQTNGAYSTYMIDCPPGLGSPPHVHWNDDESFQVIEGTFVIGIGDRTVTAGPGETVFLPRGIPHVFTNPGPGSARMLGIDSPGGHERFFIDAAKLVPGPDGRPDLAEVIAVCERHGMEVVAP